MAMMARGGPAGAPESREGERSEPELDGGAPAGAPGGPALGIPDPEVTAKAERRRFTARYKLRILEAVEAARVPGGVGALLRREGLYSSHLTKWKRQREKGALAALGPRRRGPVPEPRNPLAGRVTELEKENRRLALRLAQAEAILSIQKKVSDLLGIPLDPPESNGRSS
jgi:transposase-like protein